ncbi:MAG: TonB-dependent receptor [Pseudomonadota bacterium]
MAWVVPAWAADTAPAKDYQVYDLGEVVVSGDKPAVRQITTTNEVTAEDIADTHSLTVPEALSYVPGVSVTSGRKNEPDIRIRGFEQFESLIMIDGVPYYETNYGKLNLNQLPANMISRIDVVKGAPSVLYGPNAMAGAINIITKKPANRPTLSATAEMGDYGAYHLNASHGNSVGKFHYWLDANRRESEGWRLSDDYTPKNGSVVNKPGKTVTSVLEDGGQRNNSLNRQTSLWTKMGVELDQDNEYYLSSYFVDSTWGFPPSTVSENVFSSRPAFSGFARMDKYQDWGLDLSGKQKVSESVTLRGKVFYHDHLDDYASYSDQTYSNKIAVSRFKDYFAGAAGFADWKICSVDTLRFALHYRGDSHQERADEYLPFTEAFSYTGSAAAENEWRPSKALSLVAGVSYDWFDVTKSQKNITDKSGNLVRTDDLANPDVKDGINPMAGATYTLSDQTRFFGSVARKVRFPTLQQLYSSNTGNIKLDPQYSINYTLGVGRPFGPKVYAEAAVFYHDIQDRISRDGPGPTALYLNYASVKMYGFEASGEVKPLKDLTLRLGYTYLQARDDSDGRVTDDVINAPEHKVDLAVKYVVPQVKTRIHVQGLFLADQFDQLPTPSRPTQATYKTSGYFLANMKVTQPLWEHLDAFVALNNIFDKDYESEYGYPAPGRSFWLGLTTHF